MVRLRAAQEERGLLARTAESRNLDARHEAQRIAEIRGGLADQVVGTNDVDAREHFPGGILGARRGDDDGFEGLAAGGSRKKDKYVHRCSSRAVTQQFTGRGGNEGRAQRPHPLSPAATGAC